MADSNEPKEETVRIDLLPQSVSQPPAPNTKSRETVRIQLDPVPRDPVPVTVLPGVPSSTPKKETARIPRMPDLPSRPLPAVQMKKTQPLIAMPHAASKSASIAVAPAEKSAMPLYWVLLGVSALILSIQIWTYLS
jgi:hypothetical protein